MGSLVLLHNSKGSLNIIITIIIIIIIIIIVIIIIIIYCYFLLPLFVAIKW